MSKKTQQQKKLPVHILRGAQAETYSQVVAAMLNAARLNKFFPDPSLLLNMVSFLSPSRSHGLYDALEINVSTGLPSEREVVRIITDKELGLKQLKEATREELEEAFRSNPSEVNRRRLSRYRYYKDLAGAAVPQLFAIDMKLRSIEVKKNTAHFTVVLDRFDASENLFVRYTILLRQTDSRWTRAQIELSGDDFTYTENFRNAIAKCTSSESEFAFVPLNDLRNVAVEEVMRARIGPLYLSGVQCPKGIDRLLEEAPGSFILSLPTDRTSVSIREDRNNDPFSMLYRDFLSEEAREVHAEKARVLNYHVYKDRKFICTRNIEELLRTFLKNINARNVVIAI